MEFTTSIETASSLMPKNISELTALEIKEPCSVDRAYQLVEDYPNLIKLKIAGSIHTRQEIKQMPFGQMIGGTRGLAVDVPPPAPTTRAQVIPAEWRLDAQAMAVPTPEQLQRAFTGARTEPIVGWGPVTYTGNDADTANNEAPW